jgi:outer membrane immunogenic protein
MRRVLVSCAVLAAMPLAVASAADMPLKAPPSAVATVFSWTGFYLGAETGYGDAHSTTVRNVANANYPAGFTSTDDYKGFLGGFEAGANLQFNWLVVGVEGDWQGTTISGSTTVLSPIIAGNRTVQSRETDWVSTVTGRLGLASDRWMVFGKGGAAWRQVNNSGSNVTFTGAGGVVANDSIASSNESGYVVGGGVEWAPYDVMSFKVEYDWYNFGSQGSTAETCQSGGGCVLGSVTPAGQSTSRPTVWEIKGGMNFRFNSFLAAR